MDFFETVGLLVRRDILDAEMVCHTFYTWIEGWWQAATPLIARERMARCQIWGDLARLRDKLVTLENRYPPSEPFDVEGFVDDERTLAS